jgi:hypothetical protein
MQIGFAEQYFASAEGHCSLSRSLIYLLIEMGVPEDEIEINWSTKTNTAVQGTIRQVRPRRVNNRSRFLTM